MSQVDTLREIALRRAVDGQLNEIVRVAGELAKRLEGGSMRENQLRNVLDVALNTESLETVANYIRYQIGRGPDWRHKEFGEHVIAALASGGPVYQASQSAGGQAMKQLEKAQGEHKLGEEDLPSLDELVAEAHVLLARLFLGYLNRWFLYADREKAWNKIQPLMAS